MPTCLTEQWLRENGVRLQTSEPHINKVPLAHTYVCLSEDGRGRLANTQNCIRQIQEQLPDAHWYICSNKLLEREILRIMKHLTTQLDEVQA